MFTLEHILITLASLALTPVVCIVLLIMILASSNNTLGIRGRYVDFLLRIFEWGRVRIEQKERRESVYANSEVDSSQSTDSGFTTPSLPSHVSSVNLLHRQMPAHSHCDSALSVYQERMLRRDFSLSDSYELIKWGMEAITEDPVTKSFEAEEISSWNLLTRTNFNYQYISFRLTVIWALGFMFRYLVLLPLRITITVVGTFWLVVCTAFVGYLPAGEFKQDMNNYVMLMCFRILSRSFSAIIRFHDTQYRAQKGCICVANHTSPIDVIILAVDNCYALIGQRHAGFLGILQRALSRATEHIWFERSENKDRLAVAKRLHEHVNKGDNLPVLIFPEGTCINNTCVLMFKKGSFEVNCPIYPVAIKYDPRFGDAYWNSSKQTMVQYLLMMMTSWAIVCDVWYLPPMQKLPDEDAAVFAARVKNEIAKKGGLVELDWDGQLKRQQVKVEWKHLQQKIYSERIKFE